MVDGGVDFIALTHICDDGGRLAPESFHFLADGFKLVGLDIGQSEVSTFLCQSQHQSPT